VLGSTPYFARTGPAAPDEYLEVILTLVAAGADLGALSPAGRRLLDDLRRRAGRHAGPVEDSAEGEITFHLPASYAGREVAGVLGNWVSNRSESLIRGLSDVAQSLRL